MTKILISEKQLERLSKLVLKEQNRPATVSPVELVQMYMTNDLNKILLSKQDELAGQYFIALVGNSDQMQLRYGENGSEGVEFEKEDFGARGERFRLPITRWSITVPTDDIDLIAELEKSKPYGKDYKAFFAVNDDLTNYVKREINRVKVKFLFFIDRQASSDGFGGFTFYAIISGKKKPKGVPMLW